jgi:hypothetical protein
MEELDYFAIPSIGAIVEGWSLICPRSHDLNLAKHYSAPDFIQFVSKAVRRVMAAYGFVSVFEHGAQYSFSRTSCGTDHAHLHVLPLPFSLEFAAIEFGSSYEWLTCTPSEIEYAVNGREYLYVADRYDGENTKGRLAILQSGVSQFFRKVIAQQFGMAERYNYKLFPFTEVAARSYLEMVERR